MAVNAIARLSGSLGKLFRGPEPIELVVTPAGPQGEIQVPSGGDGVWEIATVLGRACLRPDERSHYIYFVLPEAFRARAEGGLWLEVEYCGDRYAEFRVQYASSPVAGVNPATLSKLGTTPPSRPHHEAAEPYEGLYKAAPQLWSGSDAGLRRFRRAVFPLQGFDRTRTQNHGASFRVEFRKEVLISKLVLHRQPPADLDSFRATAPLPELKKLPGRFYPINYLFIEITNACNFKCTWCPDDIMGRRRGFMKKQKVFALLDEIAAKRTWLGPIFPVKLHQMGEPFLHPDLVAIVERAESLGVGIELNTNCGLITPENIDGLYRAGLTNLILSYQTPEAESFKTRKAPRIAFDAYRDKVRLAVERKVALGARTNLEIDIMNTKYSDGFKIVSEDEQARAFMEDWIGFARGLEQKYQLAPQAHDLERIRGFRFLDQDENGSRYTLLPGVNLIWKRCHSWGNVVGEHHVAEVKDTYCPAPYDQLVVQWNGDVTTCCTDYEGRTKTANVFATSIEDVWTGDTLRRRKQDMLEGRLLDVCATCQGLQ